MDRAAVVSSLQQRLATATQDSEARKGQLTSAFDEARSAVADAGALAKQGGEAASTIVKERDKLKASTDSQLQMIADAAGVTGDQNSVIVTANAALRQHEADLQFRTNQLAEASSVGLLDNPLQWLVNTIQLPGIQRQYDAAALKTKQSADAVARMASATTASAGAVRSLEKSRSALLTEAEATAAAAEWNIKAADAKRQSAMLGADAIRAMATLDAETLSNAFRSYQVLQTEDSWQQQLREFEAQRAFRAEQRADRMADRASKEHVYTQLRTAIERGAQIANERVQLPATLDEFKQMESLPAFKQQMSKLYDLGAVTTAFGMPQLGSSPAASFAMLKNAPGIKFPDVASKAPTVVSDMQQLWADLSSGVGVPSATDRGVATVIRFTPDMKMEEKAAIFDKAAHERLGKLRDRPPITLAEATAAVPSLKNGVLYKELSSRIGANDDIQVFVDRATAAWKDGTYPNIKYRQYAKDIVTLAQNARVASNIQYSWDSFGIQPTNRMPVQIGSKVVDGTNEVEVMTALMEAKRGIRATFAKAIVPTLERVATRNPAGGMGPYTSYKGYIPSQEDIDLLEATKKRGAIK